MSKPANKTLIGIFVAGAVALAVVAVVVLGSGKFFKPTLKYVMFFDGSVKGLSVGAPVVFRGVKVGSVSEIRMAINPKDLSITIPVYVDLGAEAKFEAIGAGAGMVEAFQRQGVKAKREMMQKFIDRGLRAQLDMQSIVTGQLQIALDFYPDKPAKFVGADPKTPEIPTIPTALQAFLKKLEELPLQQIVMDIAAAVKGIDRVVNSPEIMQTMRSASQAAEEARQLIHEVNAKAGPVLSSAQGAMEDARQLIQNMDGKIGPVASNINDTVKEAQKLMRDLDEKATTLTSSIDGAVKDAQTLLRNVDGQVDPISTSVKDTLASIKKASDEAGVTLQQAQQTLVTLEGDIGENSEMVLEIKEAIRQMKDALRAIKGLAKTLEHQPDSLIFGKKRMRKEVE